MKIPRPWALLVVLLGCALSAAGAETLEERIRRERLESYLELERTLTDPRSRHRLTAIRQIDDLLTSHPETPPGARPLLAWLATDPDPRIAGPATRLARHLDGERPALGPPLPVPDTVLRALSDPRADARLYALRDLMLYARLPRTGIDPRIPTALERALGDPDPRVHHYARFMLDGLAGDVRAFSQLRVGEDAAPPGR